MKIVLLVLLLVGCGSKGNNPAVVDLNTPSTSTVGPKTAIQLEACQAFQGTEFCYCLNRVAEKACQRFIAYADHYSWNECIKPFLNDAYNGFCTISKGGY